MPNRRQFLFAAAAALALPLPATAAGMQRYANVNFEEALASGAPVVAHIDADWCPTCRAQRPVLAKLLEDGRFAAFRAFQIDYDTEKKAMRALNARDRSTIIVFRGGREVARSVADTKEAAIAALLARAL